MNVKNLKTPFVLILIGPPLSGKSTWIKNNFDLSDVVVISRDDIIMELSQLNNYNESFKSVDQKEVDKILREKLIYQGKSFDNVIIDMTNMTPKRRKYNLNFFDDYFNKVAVVFPFISKDEYNKRNEKRSNEENKFIDYKIYENMLSKYISVDKNNEGFDKIVNL